MSRTLSFRIGLLLAGLLLAATLAVLVAVWISTYQHARHQVENNLQVGLNVFTQVLAARESQLISTAEVLTADFGFRQAVASHDAATIDSALQNQGERIHADLMAILDFDGAIISNQSLAAINTADGYWQGLLGTVRARGAASVVMSLNGKIYQIFLLMVRAPIPIAVALVGFELDHELADELQQITNLQVSFVAADGVQPVILSTLADNPMNAITESLTTRTVGWRLPFSDQQVLQSVSYPLADTDGQEVTAYLTADLNLLFTEFDRLQAEITLIACTTIALALVAGLLFARNLTRPLQRLALAAQALAQGEYQHRIPRNSSTAEITDLTAAFDAMQQGIRKREERITYQATHDVITGLLNREELARQLQLLIASDVSFHLIGISLSNFRQINDMFGPSMADQCLRSISLRLLRHVNLATRLSGGGFVGQLAGEPDRRVVEDLVTRLRVATEDDDLNVNVEIHIGLVSWPSDADDITGLLRRLDIAMDTARYAADGIHHYQAGQEEDYVKRLQVIDHLRTAMRDNGRGLQMYYQPKLNLQQGRVTRVEALIRWIHPERGFVPPDFFIPLAEQAGLINALTEWVIATVIDQLHLWRQSGIELQAAINLSAQDIARPDMLEIIQRLCVARQLPVGALAFEITESEVMKQPVEAIKLLQQFRAAGFNLAIDDFGTGYSSLSQLKNMPITELKIDRDFVMRLNTDSDDQTIVKSTIELAHRFGLEVVAEGVENPQSLQLLAEWGCEWAQGYYLSRPLPADRVPAWLSEHTDKSFVVEVT